MMFSIDMCLTVVHVLIFPLLTYYKLQIIDVRSEVLENNLNVIITTAHVYMQMIQMETVKQKCL